MTQGRQDVLLANRPTNFTHHELSNGAFKSTKSTIMYALSRVGINLQIGTFVDIFIVKNKAH